MSEKKRSLRTKRIASKPTAHPSSLNSKKSVSVGIMGLGYVGLPLAVKFAEAGLSVTGFDVDTRVVQSLQKGHSHVLDVPSGTVQKIVRDGCFKATSDFCLLKKMDAVVICVPTPLRKTKEPDVQFILSAVNRIKENLRRGQLIVLESTTYPGTTRDLIMPQLQKGGFQAGRDFFLAFSPERIDPGNTQFGLDNTPKVIGGITPRCLDRARALYGTIIEKIVPVSSTECAEMVKLLENTFRAVNIGLVNEVALMCDRLGLDVWEVIDAAASKPFGFMPFYPGPGIGGHCIPLDPHYLSWKLRSLNFYSRFIELASTINASMPDYVVQRIDALLNKSKICLKGAKIHVLGVAYKKNVSDTRESPALDLIDSLMKKGAVVSYSDPHVPELKLGTASLKSQPLSPSYLKSRDCTVIITHHSAVDIPSIIRYSPRIFDTRNATSGISADNITRL